MGVNQHFQRYALPTMLCALLIPLLAESEPFLRMPDVHGDRVVFTAEGDLWLGSIVQGTASRLTRHAGTETSARFSPNGKQIAFTGEYDGVREAYVISVEGGPPKRITYRHDYATVQDWTPDGKHVLIRGRSVPRSFGLWLVPSEGGPEAKLPLEFASHAAYGAAGQFAFTRFNRAGDAWFHYKGGMQNQVWTADLSAKRFRQITDLPGTCEYPVVFGAEVLFANESDGKFRLQAVPYAGGRARVVGEPTDLEFRELSAGPGGIVFERGRGLAIADPKSGDVKELKFRLLSDRMHTAPFKTSPDAFIQSGSISPSGKRVFVEARGQILDLPTGDGEARLWKAQPGVRLRLPRPSPDGKRMAYVSDESGEQQIIVADADGANPKTVTKDGKRQIVAFQWSPDSKRLSFYDSNMRLRLLDLETGVDRLVKQEVLNWFPTPYGFSPDSKWLATTVTEPVTERTMLALYDVEKGELHRVAHPLAFDAAPAFSSDGKYLVFLSRRAFGVEWDTMLNQMNAGPPLQVCLLLLKAGEPNPLALKDQVEAEEKPIEKSEKKEGPPATVIDLEGLYERTVVLPVPPGKYQQVAMLGTRVLFAGDGKIQAFDMPAKAVVPLTPGSSFEVSADGKKLLVGQRVVDVSAKDVPATAGIVKMGGLLIHVQPLDEWRQMFWDAWRLLRDYFFVENMNGTDWPAIGAKYAAHLGGVRSRDELDILLRWMQAELGTSHQYLGAGDERNLAPKVVGAFLGIDTAPDPSGRLRIAKLLKGDGIEDASPLAAAGLGVREGQFLLSVAGQALDANSDYREPLAGRLEQIVSVVVNDKPTREGATTVFVKPIASEARLRRLDWVEQNRRYVEKASGGRVGYLYLGAMTGLDVSDFIKQFYPQRGKDALIVDTRFNNGGNTQSILNRILAEPLSGFFNMRASEASWTRNGDYFLGPMACVVNEFNVSCGEEFPHRFRDLKLGPVIGRRTYGGEVGSDPGWPLADGGRVSVPNYGMWTPKDGWIIEGPGIVPDIDVPSDPNAFGAGTDPQLDRTIAWLLDEVKRNPVVRSKQPADPVRVRRGGGGI